jgi:hypothetical protein
MSIMPQDQRLLVYVPNEGNGDVLAAAKSSFCKRTRTLYRYMLPNVSKRELDKIVLAAWDSSPDTEKQFHISKDLGTFTSRHCAAMIYSQLVKLLNPSIANPEPEKYHKISYYRDKSAEAQPTREAALTSGKFANKMSRSSAPKKAKKYSKKPKLAPTAQKVENGLLGGFPADKIDKDAFSSKCMLEDESKLTFECDSKSISQLE